MTLPFLGDILTKPSRDGVVRQMDLSLYDSSKVDDRFIDRVADINIQNSNQKSFLSFMRETSGFFGMKKEIVSKALAKLSEINVPTLIVWGKEDKILSAKNAYETTGDMKNVKFHMMNETGHFPQIDKPEEFNNLVLDFMKD